MLSGKQLEVFVDNDGSVRMWEKGWTTKCDLCNTILLALHQVSVALDIDVFVTDISRCSNTGAEAADALSKCDMNRFMHNMPDANIIPERVPAPLLRWLENPKPDRRLGHRILRNLAKRCSVLNYNNNFHI